MKQSFLPKPLLFKEWKEHKWWMFAGLVLLLFSPVKSVLGALFYPSPQGLQQGLIWRAIFPLLYHFEVTVSSSNPFYPTAYVVKGPPAVSVSAAIVAMGLVIALVAVERNRGRMWYTLTFPIRRIDLWRVKVVLAAGIVIGSTLVNFCLILFSDLYAHTIVPVQSVFLWLGENLLLELTFMAIGLALAAVITNGVAAGMFAFLLSAAPLAFGNAVLPANPAMVTSTSPYQVTASVHQIGAAARVGQFLRGLSPLHYTAGGVTQTSGSFTNPLIPLVIQSQGQHAVMNWLSVVWFIIWILAWGAVGVYAYLHAPLEHNSKFLQFPLLWPWFFWTVYGLVSFLIANSLASRHHQMPHTPYLLLGYWLVVWIALGAAATIVRYILRLRTRAA